MTRLALLLLAAVLVAGCGSTRIVHVKDPRPKIHDNSSTIAKVRANFAGKPAGGYDTPWGAHCSTYGSPQSVLNDPNATAYLIVACYREPKE